MLAPNKPIQARREACWSSGAGHTRHAHVPPLVGLTFWFDRWKAKRYLLSKTIKDFIFLQHLRNTIRIWVVVFVALFHSFIPKPFKSWYLASKEVVHQDLLSHKRNIIFSGLDFIYNPKLQLTLLTTIHWSSEFQAWISSHFCATLLELTCSTIISHGLASGHSMVS
jgi:hypothetical protein